jgi:hypothetical protein
MDRAADLNAALKFVIDRIAEEAAQFGEPLSREQHLLLQNLPSDSVANFAASDPEFLAIVPKDLNYERVCALGKSAYLGDVPRSLGTLEWEFASAVFLLHNHPMWTLLHYAGVKSRRPWWDRFLLVFFALLLIAVIMTIFFTLGMNSEPWPPVKWVGLAVALTSVMLLTRWGSRRIEQWQLEQEIERCRSGFHAMN